MVQGRSQEFSDRGGFEFVLYIFSLGESVRGGHLGESLGIPPPPPQKILKYYVSNGAFWGHLELNLLVSYKRKMYDFLFIDVQMLHVKGGIVRSEISMVTTLCFFLCFRFQSPRLQESCDPSSVLVCSDLHLCLTSFNQFNLCFWHFCHQLKFLS